ncbi:MAG TPA: hypothetical protein VGM63_17800 [Mucilaginibacter sp.]|jgi:hypothetical protein
MICTRLKHQLSDDLIKKAVISVNESINDMTAIKAENLFLDKMFPLIYQQLK